MTARARTLVARTGDRAEPQSDGRKRGKLNGERRANIVRVARAVASGTTDTSAAAELDNDPEVTEGLDAGIEGGFDLLVTARRVVAECIVEIVAADLHAAVAAYASVTQPT